MAKAWGVFTVDRNNKAEMLECFDGADGFTHKDAKEYADEIKQEEAETYGNTVLIREGHIQETKDGPLFVERRLTSYDD